MCVCAFMCGHANVYYVMGACVRLILSWMFNGSCRMCVVDLRVHVESMSVSGVSGVLVHGGEVRCGCTLILKKMVT